MKPVMGLNNWRRLIRLPWAVSNCCETNRIKLDKVVKPTSPPASSENGSGGRGDGVTGLVKKIEFTVSAR